MANIFAFVESRGAEVRKVGLEAVTAARMLADMPLTLATKSLGIRTIGRHSSSGAFRTHAVSQSHASRFGMLISFTQWITDRTSMPSGAAPSTPFAFQNAFASSAVAARL